MPQFEARFSVHGFHRGHCPFPFRVVDIRTDPRTDSEVLLCVAHLKAEDAQSVRYILAGQFVMHQVALILEVPNTVRVEGL